MPARVADSQFSVLRTQKKCANQKKCSWFPPTRTGAPTFRVSLLPLGLLHQPRYESLPRVVVELSPPASKKFAAQNAQDARKPRWLRLSEQNFRVDKWSLCRG